MNTTFFKPYKKFFLSLIALIVILFGWKYYWLGFIVPLVMLIGFTSPFLNKGRFICGNFCPRGAFYDQWVSKLSLNKKIPLFIKKTAFRWATFVFIFSFFSFQLIRINLTWESLGHLFWVMCTVTSVLGVILGVFFKHRSWCALCPVGTFAGTINRDKQKISIDSNKCSSCGLCEKKCPLDIEILKYSEQEKIADPDCLKCGACISTCPKKALHY